MIVTLFEQLRLTLSETSEAVQQSLDRDFTAIICSSKHKRSVAASAQLLVKVDLQIAHSVNLGTNSTRVPGRRDRVRFLTNLASTPSVVRTDSVDDTASTGSINFSITRCYGRFFEEGCTSAKSAGRGRN